MIATRSKIKIGNHVVFGTKVSIRGGDHRIDFIGKYIDKIDDSMNLPENDKDVIFEGDNWIGMNSTILKEGTVGKGAIIVAGSVVTKMFQPTILLEVFQQNLSCLDLTRIKLKSMKRNYRL